MRSIVANANQVIDEVFISKQTGWKPPDMHGFLPVVPIAVWACRFSCPSRLFSELIKTAKHLNSSRHLPIIPHPQHGVI
jgi:hypothetical protein